MTKYHSRWTECGKGHKHQSKKEADICNLLTLLEKGGKVRDVGYQPEFILQPGFTGLDGKKVRPIKYIADFQFYDVENQKTRVVDVKGYHNQLYVIKKKLFDYMMKNAGIGLMLEENI